MLEAGREEGLETGSQTNWDPSIVLAIVKKDRRLWFRTVVRWLVVLGILGAQPARLSADSLLIYPRLANDALTGVSFFNPSDQAATVSLTAYDDAGELVQGNGVTNPTQLELAPKQQLARLVTEIFGPDLDPNLVGWIEATSPIDGLTGFFLHLDSPPFTFLDGADLPAAGHKIFFKRVRVDAPDGETTTGRYSTEINLVNTEPLSAEVDLFLVDGGQVIEVTPNAPDLTLPPRAAGRLDVATFFSVGQLEPSAYILAVSTTRIAGFEFVRSPANDLIGLNAQTALQRLNRIHFPQLAVLGGFKMDLGVVNYSSQSADLTITAYRPDGTPYAAPHLQTNPVLRRLGAGSALREDVESLFGFNGSQTLDGWIGIQSSASAIDGYVNYGLPDTGAEAAVAALTHPHKAAVFTQLATQAPLFTGVALLNASSMSASVRIVVSNPAGMVLGTRDLVLQPGRRIARQVPELVAEAADRAGGVVWINSNVPLYLTSLYGDLQTKVMANVPPQFAPPVYQPDQDLPRLTVEPLLGVIEAGESRQFEATGGSGAVTWSVNGVEDGSSELGTVISGLYQAPDGMPPAPNLTVSASDGPLTAAATVDVLARQELTSGSADIVSLAYLDLAGRLYGIANEDPAGGQTSGDGVVFEIAADGFEEVFRYPGEVLGQAIAYPASDGSQFLLLSGQTGGKLMRLDPARAASRDVVTDLERPEALALDPVARRLLVGDAAGVAAVSLAQLESDLISNLESHGSPASRLFGQTDLGHLTVDSCSGEVFFSQPVSGAVMRFRPLDDNISPVVDAVEGTAALLQLYRRGTSCAQAPYLLAVQTTSNQVGLLLTDRGERLNWLDFNAPKAVAFLPGDNSLAPGQEVVVVAESPAAGASPGSTRISMVAVAGLYDSVAENPVNARPTGSYGDPAGDTFGPGSAREHDIVEMTANHDGSELTIRVFFKDTIAPCLQDPNQGEDSCSTVAAGQSADAVAGFVDLDLDRNPSTGRFAFSDRNGPSYSGLGVEAYLDFFRYHPDLGGVALFRLQDGDFALAGRVPVDFSQRSLTVTVPLCSLNDDDGVVDVAAVFGTALEGPSDVAPNGGWLTSGRIAAGATVLSAQVGKSARAH